jgi:hypothetical protein
MSHIYHCIFSGIEDLSIDNFHFGAVAVSGERLFGGGE